MGKRRVKGGENERGKGKRGMWVEELISRRKWKGPRRLTRTSPPPPQKKNRLDRGGVEEKEKILWQPLVLSAASQTFDMQLCLAFPPFSIPKLNEHSSLCLPGATIRLKRFSFSPSRLFIRRVIFDLFLYRRSSPFCLVITRFT